MRVSRSWPGLLLSLPAMAHQLFLMPSSFHVSPGERITVALHNGDSFPDSEGPPALQRLRDVALHAGGLQYNVTNIRVDDKRAIGDARIPAKGSLILTARTIPNFIELKAEAFEKYLKGEGMSQIIEWRKERGESEKPGREIYSKYVKAILRSGGNGDDGFGKVVGFAVELIPEKDPYALKAGESMPVRLLWRGKPASGIMVEAAIAPSAGGGPAESRQIGRTDAAGRVSIHLNKAGKWRVHAIAMERCQDPAKADWESFWATLTFDLSR
jgi:uncharacterized GH25 family protein